MSYLIGCDPEVFVKDAETDQFVSAHNMIPGTKQSPFKVPNGAVQVDGMALEFNTDPAATADEFVNNIRAVYQRLGQMIPFNHDLVAIPTAQFAPEVFANSPPEALELGCEPDFNAYTGLPNPRPNAEGRNFRTASGHVHIGWTSDVDPNDPGHLEDCKVVVKQLDHVLGFQASRFDRDNQRRQLYGQAGAFRPKSYGVEYRVLSNQWIRTEDHIRWVFNATQRALSLLEEGVFFPNMRDAQYYINSGMRGDPYNFTYMSRYDVPLPPLMNNKTLKKAIA